MPRPVLPLPSGGPGLILPQPIADQLYQIPQETSHLCGCYFDEYIEPLRQASVMAIVPAPLPLLPTAELEAAVLAQLRGILRVPGMVADVVARAGEQRWTRRRSLWR